MRDLIDLLIHFVSGFDNAGVGFVRALALNQIDELFDDVDVRLFGVSLHESAEAVGATGSADLCVAGCVCDGEEGVADAVEAARILEVC